jgi:hypothetical protein
MGRIRSRLGTAVSAAPTLNSGKGWTPRCVTPLRLRAFRLAQHERDETEAHVRYLRARRLEIAIVASSGFPRCPTTCQPVSPAGGHQPRVVVTCPTTPKGPLPPGKGPELRKLVAGLPPFLGLSSSAAARMQVEGPCIRRPPATRLLNRAPLPGESPETRTTPRTC